MKAHPLRILIARCLFLLSCIPQVLGGERPVESELDVLHSPHALNRALEYQDSIDKLRQVASNVDLIALGFGVPNDFIGVLQVALDLAKAHPMEVGYIAVDISTMYFYQLDIARTQKQPLASLPTPLFFDERDSQIEQFAEFLLKLEAINEERRSKGFAEVRLYPVGHPQLPDRVHGFQSGEDDPMLFALEAMEWASKLLRVYSADDVSRRTKAKYPKNGSDRLIKKNFGIAVLPAQFIAVSSYDIQIGPNAFWKGASSTVVHLTHPPHQQFLDNKWKELMSLPPWRNEDLYKTLRSEVVAAYEALRREEGLDSNSSETMRTTMRTWRVASVLFHNPYQRLEGSTPWREFLSLLTRVFITELSGNQTLYDVRDSNFRQAFDRLLGGMPHWARSNAPDPGRVANYIVIPPKSCIPEIARLGKN